MLCSPPILPNALYSLRFLLPWHTMSQEVAPLHTRAFTLAFRAAQRALTRRSRLLRLVMHGYRRLVLNQAG